MYYDFIRQQEQLLSTSCELWDTTQVITIRGNDVQMDEYCRDSANIPAVPVPIVSVSL